MRPLIVDALAGVDCDILIYEPTPAYQNVVKRRGVEKLTPARALMADMIRRFEVLGFDCSMLEAQKLAWFLSRAMQRLNLTPNPIADDFAANRYGPYSDKVRHPLDSLDGSYQTHDRRDEVGAYLTSPGAAPYRPALEDATRVIDGFQSPHGLELLTTVDWLTHARGTTLDAEGMMAAIACWPGPDGAAERKARVFTRHHVGVAVEHLRAVQLVGA